MMGCVEHCLILHLCMVILELPEPASWQNKVKNQCFVINDHVRHEFDYRTYLDLKSSSVALNSLKITSVSRLGCSFVPTKVHDPWSSGSWRASLWVQLTAFILDLDPCSDLWSLIPDAWSLIYVTICCYMPLYVAMCRYMSLYIGVCPCIGTVQKFFFGASRKRILNSLVGLCMYSFWKGKSRNSDLLGAIRGGVIFLIFEFNLFVGGPDFHSWLNLARNRTEPTKYI